jgi:hypothetical protein
MVLASDAVDALAAIAHAIGNGQVAPSEGAALASIVASYAQAIKASDLELRLDTMEDGFKKLKES